MNNVKVISSAAQLFKILLAVPAAQFMTFLAETSIVSKMSAPNKKLWGARIFKRARISTRSYVDYKRSAELHAEKNGLAAPDIQPRAHGFNIKGSPFAITTSKANPGYVNLLLKVDIMSVLSSEYIDRETGDTLSTEFVHDLFTPSALKKRPVSKTGRPYVEYGIAGIRTLSANGEQYVIADHVRYDDNQSIRDKYDSLVAVGA